MLESVASVELGQDSPVSLVTIVMMLRGGGVVPQHPRSHSHGGAGALGVAASAGTQGTLNPAASAFSLIWRAERSS